MTHLIYLLKRWINSSKRAKKSTFIYILFVAKSLAKMPSIMTVSLLARLTGHSDNKYIDFDELEY